MNRINQTFDKLKKQNKTALVTFVVGGDPDLETSQKIIETKIEAGADIVEIGIPYSDPLADGPVIQAAAGRALQSGTTTEGVFEMVRKIRKKTEVPLVFLVYYNLILQYGMERFVRDCHSLIDGLIIPDLPFEEQGQLLALLDQEKTALIPLLAPTSKDRIPTILESHKEHGFVYCVTTMGVTGMDGRFHKELEEYLKEVRSYSTIPICAGFGVRDQKDFLRLSELSDGVIIGSAIVNQIAEQGFEKETLMAFLQKIKS